MRDISGEDRVARMHGVAVALQLGYYILIIIPEKNFMISGPSNC